MHANIRLNGHGTWVEAALTHWQAKINLKKFNKVDLKEVHHMANAFVLSRDKLMTFSADVEFSSSKEFFEESYCWETCKFMTQTIDGKRLLARLMDRLLLGDYLTDSFEEHQFKSVLCIVMGGLIILGHQFNSSIFVYRYLRTAFLYKECWPILLKILSLNWAPCLDNSGLLMLLGESCLPSSLRENLLSQMEAQEVSALSNYKTNFLDYGFDPFGLYEDVSPEHPKRNNAPSSVSDDEQYKYISVLANWVKNQVQHLNDSEVKHLNINELKSLKPIVLSKKYYEYLINDSIKYSLLFIKNVEHSPHAAHLFVQSLTTMLIKFNLIPATYESASLFLSEKLGLKIKIKEGEEKVLVPSASSATILRNLPWKRNRTRQNNAQESGVHDIKNSLVC